MKSDLLKEVRRFVNLQVLLVSEFRRAYPGVANSDFLLHAPKTGCLDTARGLWLFRKHGVGFSFVNAHGVWVDVDREFDSPELFDAWRLQAYLESVGCESADLVSELSMYAEAGVLLRRPDQFYQLADTPRAVNSDSGGGERRAPSPLLGERDAIVRLVANALYEVRLRLGPGREKGMDPSLDVAARLAYALHNEALALVGEPYHADLEGALRRIAAIDQDFPGERLMDSFHRVLSLMKRPPDHEY